MLRYLQDRQIIEQRTRRGFILKQASSAAE